MRKIDQLFTEYGESHQNHTNKLIHWICVPFIFWSIIGFISLIPTPHFCFQYFGCISVASLIAIALVTIFYFSLSWRTGLIMIFVMLLMEHLVYFINIEFAQKSWMVFLVIFSFPGSDSFMGIK